MITLKRDAKYIDLYLERTEKIDRCIRGFLAIAASSSIGGWLFFKEYSFLWATIVAGSQVLQVVKEYLPYQTRLKALAGLSQDLNAISLSAENNWYKVASGELYDDDIHDLRFDLKQRKLRALQKHFPVSSLPMQPRLQQRADDETDRYFLMYIEEDGQDG